MAKLIIGMCRLNGIAPEVYHRYRVAKEITQKVTEMLP